jgi:hypothetical protein
MPVYRFEPLPVAVTAGEGLRQIAYYVYQSAGEPEDWAKAPLRRLLNRLRHTLLEHVPDYRDAPWGWGSRELEARSARPAPPNLPAAQPPARVVEVLEMFAAVDLRIDTRNVAFSSGVLGDPRLVLCDGTWPSRYSGFAPAALVICADVGTAEVVFLHMARGGQMFGVDSHVYRWGDVVLSTHQQADDVDRNRRIDAGLAQLTQPERLGEPDDQWWNNAAPLAELDAEVVASHVRLDHVTAGTHLAEHVTIARTPAQQRALVELLADDDVRAQVAAISTTRHSILLLRGVAEISDATSATVTEEIMYRPDHPERAQRLSLHTTGASSGFATVVRVQRLAAVPAMVWIEDPGLRRGIPASKASGR